MKVFKDKTVYKPIINKRIAKIKIKALNKNFFKNILLKKNFELGAMHILFTNIHINMICFN